jgi:hypothetical protein
LWLTSGERRVFADKVEGCTARRSSAGLSLPGVGAIMTNVHLRRLLFRA